MFIFLILFRYYYIHNDVFQPYICALPITKDLKKTETNFVYIYISSCRHAYVEYSSLTDATNAHTRIHNSELDNSTLHCTYSRRQMAGSQLEDRKKLTTFTEPFFKPKKGRHSKNNFGEKRPHSKGL